MDARESAGQRGERFRIDSALAHVFQQFLERGRGLAIQGTGIGLVLHAHAYRVNNDETFFGACARRDGLQLVG